jgi:hypothetical protein
MASAFDGSVPLKHLLLGILPRDMADFINTHILHPHSPFQSYRRAALVQAQHAIDALSPILQPLADRLLALLAENQGAVGIFISLVVLAVLVFVVTLVQRVMMWCTRVAMRIVFWGAGWRLGRGRGGCWRRRGMRSSWGAKLRGSWLAWGITGSKSIIATMSRRRCILGERGGRLGVGGGR